MSTASHDDVLLISDKGAVRVLTLNRPEQRNAFSIGLYRALAQALNQAQADPAVGAVVLTGSGGAFCAGTDLAELSEIAAGRPPEGAGEGFPGLLRAVSGLDVPLIAAVNGAGVGLGMTILSFCDLVLMASTARLKVPFVDMGVPPEAASSLLLPIRMGWQQAARVLLTGDWLDAEAAVASGLALEVVAPESLLDRAVELATKVASGPSGAGRRIKALMRAAESDAIAAARAREDAAYGALFGNRG